MPEIDPRFLFIVTIVVVFVLVRLMRHSGGNADLRRQCRACGAAHPAFARFCRRCGKRL